MGNFIGCLKDNAHAAFPDLFGDVIAAVNGGIDSSHNAIPFSRSGIQILKDSYVYHMTDAIYIMTIVSFDKSHDKNEKLDDRKHLVLITATV
jgi:hypothetical protein